MKIRDISYYLFESYKDAVEKFSQEENKEKVNQYLDTFKQLAKKGIVTGQEKDIGYWIKQGWYDLKEFVDSKSQEKTQSQVKQSKKKDAIIAHDDDEKMTVIPLTKDASCFYGKGTRWCTSATESKNHFIEYFYIDKTTLIYIFIKNSGEKYAVSHKLNSNDYNYFDDKDNSISVEQFKNKTNINTSEIISWINSYKDAIAKAKDINNVSDEIQIEIINESNKGAEKFEEIKSPSEKVQLAAVQNDGYFLYYIKNPTEKVQWASIQKDGSAIQFIDNPSDEMKEMAIHNKPSSIVHIKNNVSEELKFYAIKRNGTLIRHIDNPSEELQLAAVDEDNFAISHIDNPSEKVQMLAVTKGHPSVIGFVENPSEKAQIEAIKRDVSVLAELVGKGRPISEKVQLESIKSSSEAIGYLDNPTEKAKKLHQELWGEQ